MANESRPRISHKSLSAQEEPPIIPASSNGIFQYKPLDTTGKEFRVLILHPKSADENDQSIQCSLVHKEFRETPAYEALSYMWGDQTVPYSAEVKVNGFSFPVGHNLGCALARLRNEGDRAVWIDAICIHQTNDYEKSFQIQLMPFIYERAKKCLIWLGDVSVDLDLSILEEYPWDRTFEAQKSKKKKTINPLADGDLTVLSHLANNPYWHRVWIIQEIGLARKLEIIYGTYLTKFSDFTSHLSFAHALQDCIPLRLQAQLDRKHHDTHDLQYLIESHQTSLCQEPRDHIYGFVGLSTDGQEFPIDYSKTHYEVWKDVIMFKNSKSTGPQHDILTFAALVKEKLGAGTIFREEVMQDSNAYSAAVADAQTNRDGQFVLSSEELCQIHGHITIESRLVGYVGHIGPTCPEIIAVPRTTIGWRTSINQHVNIDRRPQVREESDLFLENLEALWEHKLDMVESYVPLVLWKPKPPRPKKKKSKEIPFGQPEQSDNAVSDDWLPRKKNTKKRQLPLSKQPDSLESTVPVPVPVPVPDSEEDLMDLNGQRLFLMEEGTPPTPKDLSLGSIGILPPGARKGDSLYQIHGITRLVVVRNETSYCRVVGTALISKTLEVARAARDSGGDDLPFQKAEFETDDGFEQLDLYMDIAKAYQLLD